MVNVLVIAGSFDLLACHIERDSRSLRTFTSFHNSAVVLEFPVSDTTDELMMLSDCQVINVNKKKTQ